MHDTSPQYMTCIPAVLLLLVIVIDKTAMLLQTKQRTYRIVILYTTPGKFTPCIFCRPRTTHNLPFVPSVSAASRPYVMRNYRIISDFDDGLLDAEPGVGLRQLLASKLQCEVMRVSKKFCGWASVGKRAFRPVHNLNGDATRVRIYLYETTVHAP